MLDVQYVFALESKAWKKQNLAIGLFLIIVIYWCVCVHIAGLIVWGGSVHGGQQGGSSLARICDPRRRDIHLSSEGTVVFGKMNLGQAYAPPVYFVQRPCMKTCTHARTHTHVTFSNSSFSYWGQVDLYKRRTFFTLIVQHQSYQNRNHI